MNEIPPAVGRSETAGRAPFGGLVGLVLLTLVLLGWGVAQPFLWSYLAGAVSAGLLGAGLVHRLAGRVGRKAVRALVAVATAFVVAGVVVAVPAVARYVRTDGAVGWSTEVPTRWVNIVPLRDRIYLYEQSRGFRVLDRSTGRQLFSVGGVEVSGDVAGDGSMVLSNRTTGEYYSAAGTRLWRLAGVAWLRALGANTAAGTSTSPTVVAVAGGVTVFRTCGREDCWYAGIDRHGEVVWRWVGGEIQPEPQVPFPGADKAGPLPAVVVAETRASGDDGEYVTLAVADGQELDRRPTAPGAGTVSGSRGGAGAVGDLAVFTGRDGGGCTVTGVRAGRQVWRAKGLPCADGGGPLWPSLLVEHRMYAEVTDESSVTVDLRNGRWREIDAVAFSAREHLSRKIGIPGDDVIVYRDGPDLTGVDAGSGRRLWAFADSTGETPGVDVGSGAVVVLSRPGGHNPLVPADVRDDGYLVTVLDPRDGSDLGRLLSLGGVATSAPVGDGRALVVTENEPEARLVGRD
ncbi:MAG: hypothetical protein GEV10_02250 [Streptosporangiales bacterium]|nr:hypothetical protein [Streptosporangiales bacterium]